jgi:hypothetical protein
MTIKTSQAILQPHPTSVRLSNKFELVISSGMWCAWCGEDIRAYDAEPLDDDGGMRLICRCGHLILQYEWRP